VQDQEPDVFDTRDDDNLARLKRARTLLARYNRTTPDEADIRRDMLDDLFGRVGAGVWVEPPFFCDYGDNIRLGAGVFVNVNCVVLDGAAVEIGPGTLLGPAVQIYATSHPIAPEDRMYQRDGVPAYNTTAEPISIGSNVWIGGGAIILPGVRIGDGSTIGAGAVVTQDVPSRVFAAGNPCKVLREL
jgi:maltose O-acetyltransferase